MATIQTPANISYSTIQLSPPVMGPGGTSGWDLMVDTLGNIAVADPPYALAQDAASECRLFAGEDYYDKLRGVPYFGQILALAPPLSLVRAYLSRAALLVPGVISAQVFFTSFINRKLSGQVQVTNKQGVTVAGSF